MGLFNMIDILIYFYDEDHVYVYFFIYADYLPPLKNCSRDLCVWFSTNKGLA